MDILKGFNKGNKAKKDKTVSAKVPNTPVSAETKVVDNVSVPTKANDLLNKVDNERKQQQDIIREFDALISNAKVWASFEKNSRDYKKKGEFYHKQVENLSSDSSEIQRFMLNRMVESVDYLFKSDKTSNDLIKIVTYLKETFKSQLPAESVMYGADKLNAFVIQFIGHLEIAIRDAHIKKIISCMDVLQYILRIGYRKENVNNQERLDEVVNEKIEVITNVCTELINAIDRYYNTYLKYELSEKRYKQLYEENREMVKRIFALPEETRRIIDSFGFNNSAEMLRKHPELNDNSNISAIIHSAKQKGSSMALAKNEKDSSMSFLFTLEESINSYIYAITEASIIKPDNFNLDTHLNSLRSINIKSINKIKEMDRAVNKTIDATFELDALVKEVEENPEKLRNLSNSLAYIEEQEEIRQTAEERNKILEKEMQKRMREDNIRQKKEEEERLIREIENEMYKQGIAQENQQIDELRKQLEDLKAQGTQEIYNERQIIEEI